MKIYHIHIFNNNPIITTLTILEETQDSMTVTNNNDNYKNTILKSQLNKVHNNAIYTQNKSDGISQLITHIENNIRSLKNQIKEQNALIIKLNKEATTNEGRTQQRWQTW